MKNHTRKILLKCGIFLYAILSALHCRAASVRESPYVSFSPDGRAFTTNAGDTACQWYETGTIIKTGITSSVRVLKTGEHYYQAKRQGNVPVGFWKVEYKTGHCCHNHYPPENTLYHGVAYGRQKCFSDYYSGWRAYCADCQERITPVFIYMSSSAAKSITSLDTGLDYYYLCPFCSNLEQGAPLDIHYCKAISWNRYQIRYHPNAEGMVTGYMESTMHMYGNETVYEGKTVTPATRLGKNTYKRTGYLFLGWNTSPDGSGDFYVDEAEVINLSNENYDEKGGGVITLYAMWQKCSSILEIDPAGGTYQGKKEITVLRGEYASSYILDPEKLTAPAGYLLQFDTMGGEKMEAVRGTMVFFEWLYQTPLHGKYRGGRYYYLGEQDSIDRFTADYQPEEILLPEARKEGSSFGGWFYDKECLAPAGGAGEKIWIQKDTVLYAKWVDLVLKAEDNYAVYDGKGAVDLSWEQPDGKSKYYLLYQKEEGGQWRSIADASDVSRNKTVSRTFYDIGKQTRYVVPYTGRYLLTLRGAAGEDYGGHTGGKGGLVSARVWLSKGEVLTIQPGGTAKEKENSSAQENAYAGGNGEKFGNGGAASVISGSQSGILLVAGGGGGATSLRDGEAGGTQNGKTAEGSNGQDGDAGGGGGFLGGRAGKVRIHTHTTDCIKTECLTDTILDREGGIVNEWAQQYGNLSYAYDAQGDYYAYSKNIWGIGAHGRGDSALKLEIGAYYDGNGQLCFSDIPAEGGSTLFLHMNADSKGKGGLTGGSLTVRNQDGSIIFAKTLAQVKRYTDVDGSNAQSIASFLERFEEGTGGKRGSASGWYHYYDSRAGYYYSSSAVYWNEQIELPEDTTGIRITLYSDFGDNEAWMGSGMESIYLEKEEEKLCCGMTEGQILENEPSYGGSNYAGDEATGGVSLAGTESGEGKIEIQSLDIGYRESQNLKGVSAPDKAAPDGIDKQWVQKEALSADSLRLKWNEPADNGTCYYHKAESYSDREKTLLSTSNVTGNVLTSGIAGYYYAWDEEEQKQVTAENGIYTQNTFADLVLGENVMYFHIAAADKAGNLSETVHIQIRSREEEIAWPLATGTIDILAQEENVFAKKGGTWYVRADGKTPFYLSFDSRILGQAREDYQIQRLTFHMREEVPGSQVDLSLMAPDSFEELRIDTPLSELTEEEIIYTQADGIGKTQTGPIPFTEDGYTRTVRRQKGVRLEVSQRFVMQTSKDNVSVRVLPSAKAEPEGKNPAASDWEADCKNGILLIGDGKPPVIDGLEELKKAVGEWKEEFGKKEKVSVLLTAKDDGSGLKEFYVSVSNEDNGSDAILKGTDGVLEVVMQKEDSLFTGDFQMILFASDQVGNESRIGIQGEDFMLRSHIEHMAEASDAAFRGGESGILVIEAFGYPDRIEVTFPEEFTQRDNTLNRTFEYPSKTANVTEKVLFMIPLDIPRGEYAVLVTAYKGDKVLTREPVLWTLGEKETILGRIRTRLR